MAEFITELDNILETTHDITRPGHVVHDIRSFGI